MKFGTKVKDVADTGGEVYLRNFKKGDTEVRFLEEIEDWIQFREHYTREGKSFPCTGDRKECPGCTSSDEAVQRSSNRYVANAVLTKNGAVFAFKMGKTLVDRLATRSERNNGTITSRNYTIIRTGDGLDTEYDVEQGDKDATIDIKAYKDQIVDVEAILKANFEAAFGKPEKAKKAKADDDVPPSKPVTTKASSAQEEDDIIDEDVVRNMNRSQLVRLYEKAGLEPNEDMSTKELAEFLISEVGK